LFAVRPAGQNELVDAEGVVFGHVVGGLAVAAGQGGSGAAPEETVPAHRLG
jgi:hypothetical protein